jgi:hypothetical protein
MPDGESDLVDDGDQGDGGDAGEEKGGDAETETEREAARKQREQEALENAVAVQHMMDQLTTAAREDAARRAEQNDAAAPHDVIIDMGDVRIT